MLTCHVKSCKNGKLSLQECELTSVETEFNSAFMQNIISKLDFTALQTAVNELSLDFDASPFIPSADDEMEQDVPDESALQSLHALVMNTKIYNGRMVCTACGHVYPIVDGIPNMLLQDHEV
jgi:multifunctional methyltransferase subunit TRM112